MSHKVKENIAKCAIELFKSEVYDSVSVNAIEDPHNVIDIITIHFENLPAEGFPSRADALDSIDLTSDKPHMVVAHTTKGYGVSYMEGVAKWHHGVPTEEQYAQAVNEIEQRITELES